MTVGRSILIHHEDFCVYDISGKNSAAYLVLNSVVPFVVVPDQRLF